MNDSQEKRILKTEKPPLLHRWLALPWGMLTWLFFIMGPLIVYLSDVFFVVLKINLGVDEKHTLLISGGIAILCLICFAIRKVAQEYGIKITVPQYPKARKALIILFLAFPTYKWATRLVPEWQFLSKSELEKARRFVKFPHTFGDGQFVIRTWSHWQEMEAPNLGQGHLYLADPLNDLHLMAFAVPQIDIDVKNLKEAIELMIQLQSEEFEKTRVEDIEFSEHGGVHGFYTHEELGISKQEWLQSFPGANARLHVVTERTKLIYHFGVLDCGDMWVNVVFWTTPSQYAKFEPQFDSAINSVTRVTKGSP